MLNLPDKEIFLHNFFRCDNWEEKYLYIIELGNYLLPLSTEMRNEQHRVVGCQSQAWILVVTDINGNIQLYGDSDAAIVKGLIAMLFILCHGLTPEEIIVLDVYPFFNSLSLTQHLTLSRSQGLEAIVQNIRAQAVLLQ